VVLDAGAAFDGSLFRATANTFGCNYNFLKGLLDFVVGVFTPARELGDLQSGCKDAKVWDAAHTVFYRMLRSVVNVDLDDLGASFVFLRKVLDGGRSSLTGSTPVGVEVHEDWNWGLKNFLNESVVCYLNHNDLHPIRCCGALKASEIDRELPATQAHR
jgi:hypothetical protein